MSKLSQIEKQSVLKTSLFDKDVKGDASEFVMRYLLNRSYVNSLPVDDLLLNYNVEAGVRTTSTNHLPEIALGGWENPCCQLRGHFTGHWLSACARIYAQTGDPEVYGKACQFIDGIAKCQEMNGGQWCGSIPEKYFWKMEKGQAVWAPHYTVHKLLMGLVDMKKFANNDKALEIADKWADWFIDWTAKFSREEMNRILNYETGGMLEVWVDLYDITGDKKYKTLIERYYRPQLFDKLLAGEDPLTLKHANSTIPEIHGCARAYEVLGDIKYRKIVEAYWKQAVTERGFFATGGQTAGEVWTEKHQMSNRLSRTNQEHCTVYNMIRLADFLYRWTGDVEYLDYIERNIYNGILAQQNPKTGMVIYYLPLHPGAKKAWGTPREDFWCCHGSLVQAHTIYVDLTCYTAGDELTIAQFIPGVVTHKGAKVHMGYNLCPDKTAVLTIKIDGNKDASFPLRVRIPWWAKDYSVNGAKAKARPKSGFATFKVSGETSYTITFTKTFTMVPLEGEPGTYAFINGPEVLAAITDHDQVITVPKGDPHGAFRPYDEADWHPACYHLIGQGLKFVPISLIVDETYTVYFPVVEK